MLFVGWGFHIISVWAFTSSLSLVSSNSMDFQQYAQSTMARRCSSFAASWLYWYLLNVISYPPAPASTTKSHVLEEECSQDSQLLELYSSFSHIRFSPEPWWFYWGAFAPDSISSSNCASASSDLPSVAWASRHWWCCNNRLVSPHSS